MRHSRRYLLILLVAGSSCVTPEPVTRFTPAWERFDPTGDHWLTTRKAQLLADCQMHNLLSLSLPERNLSAEAAAATAIRPPQLDLFSPDVLQWILEEGDPEADVVLHLGDALDLGCTGEFDRFLEVMGHARRPWFMAPGNHDFFYLGVYDPPNRGVWEDASYGAGEPLTKDHFIRLYVATILGHDDAGCAALRQALGVAEGGEADVAAIGARLPVQFDWESPPGTGGLLKSIAWSLDEEKPWRSFILQQIDFTVPGDRGFRSYGYLLDSCQYGRRPELLPNGWKSWPLSLNCGFTGEMLPDQLRTLRAWLDRREVPCATTVYCHHPFDDLAPRARSSLGFLWREYRFAALVTAHTHAGYFANHDLGGETDELEMNLGSTTDWPMEWRSFQGWIDPELKEIFIKAGRRTLLDDLREREGFFEPGWEVPPGAPDDYRRYKQGEAAGSVMLSFALAHHVTPYWVKLPRVRPNKAAQKTERQVKDTLLWTYDRLIRMFPTDPGHEPPWPPECTDDAQVRARIAVVAEESEIIEPKIALLADLARFERGRRTVDPATGEPADDQRRRFKLSQAAWASRYEAQRGRRLRVEDELIRVAWRDERAADAAQPGD